MMASHADDDLTPDVPEGYKPGEKKDLSHYEKLGRYCEDAGALLVSFV